VTGLQAELLLVKAGAQRAGFELNLAYIPDAFREPNRSLFDREYMQPCSPMAPSTPKKGTAFESAITGALELRTNTPK